MTLEKVKLTTVAEIIRETVTEFEGEKNYIATGDLGEEIKDDIEKVTFFNRPSRADLTAKNGDLIVARMQNTNKVLIINSKEENYIFSTGFIVLRPSIKIYKNYLFHYLKSSLFQNIKDSLCTGATQKAINNQELNKIEIPLPPLEEQKRIAEILDTADALRQTDKQLIEKYNKLQQSVFLDMFGDPVENPKGWEYISLENMLEFLTSGSRGWAKYYSNSGTIFLRIQNVGYNKMKLNDLTYVNAPNSAEAKRTTVNTGDILLTITADLGRTAVIPSDFPKAHINQHLAILRLKKNYNPNFVSAYIASKGGQSLFVKLDKGGVKAGLNFNDIKSYSVFNPPIELQNKFAGIIEKIEQQIQTAEKSLAKSEELFNSLMQRAFKGVL